METGWKQVYKKWEWMDSIKLASSTVAANRDSIIAANRDSVLAANRGSVLDAWLKK